MELKRLLLCLLLAGVSCSVSSMSLAEVEALTWGEWGECTKPCGGGTQSRRPVCDEGLEAQICLYLKSSFGKKQLKEERPCNTQQCIGTWGDWTDWQPCSSTCGSVSYQMKTRSCHGGDTVQGGWKCTGSSYQWRSCDGLPPCPTVSHSLQGPEHQSGPILIEPSYSSLQSYDKVSQVELEDSSSSSAFEY